VSHIHVAAREGLSLDQRGYGERRNWNAAWPCHLRSLEWSDRSGRGRTGSVERHGHTRGRLKHILEILRLGLLMANRGYLRGEARYKNPGILERKKWIYLCHLTIKRDYMRRLKEWDNFGPLTKVSRTRGMGTSSNHSPIAKNAISHVIMFPRP
jgi:hypothetical protein